jgi:xylan 1,4-beta-xylosidase
LTNAHFFCDWSERIGTLSRFWEHTVGSCHAPLALRADWREQLRRCREELGFRHVRFHGILDDDMSTLTSRAGRPTDSFFNADSICDFLLSIGMKPFVELSFMPETLASGRSTVFHYRGNVTPPRSYRDWAGLIGRLTKHWRDRYGAEEVCRWPFEVWNEPNLRIFWRGSQADYFDLYRHTVQSIKDVDERIPVGGPATAKEAWLSEFVDFCERRRLPADFVSTHHYPNDVLWHEGQDTEEQLANSRRSILREWTQNARHRARGRPLYYTEWNCSSNLRYPPQDESYAAAFVVKTILEVAGLVDVYSFWTFSDIFEEGAMPSLPFHGGFGLLTLHGVAKPNYRGFELLHRLEGELLLVDGRHPTVDAWAVRGAGKATVLLTNHALPRHPIERARVSVRFRGVALPRAVTAERIDADHANPKRAWLEMGSPPYLNERQIDRLHEASRLERESVSWNHESHVLSLEIEVPPQAVAAITIDFDGDDKAGRRHG